MLTFQYGDARLQDITHLWSLAQTRNRTHEQISGLENVSSLIIRAFEPPNCAVAAKSEMSPPTIIFRMLFITLFHIKKSHQQNSVAKKKKRTLESLANRCGGKMMSTCVVLAWCRRARGITKAIWIDSRKRRQTPLDNFCVDNTNTWRWRTLPQKRKQDFFSFSIYVCSFKSLKLPMA